MRERYTAGIHDQELMYAGRPTLTSMWHKRGPNRVWSYWHELFMQERNMFVMYANIRDGTTLCGSLRPKGLNFNGSFGLDAPIMSVDDPDVYNFPELSTLTWHDFDAQAHTAAFVQPRKDCEVAICTVANTFSTSLDRFLRAILELQPDSRVYLASPATLRHSVQAAYPTLKLSYDTVYDRYGKLSYAQLKVVVMRRALAEGCSGAWFLHTRQRLQGRPPALGQQDGLYRTCIGDCDRPEQEIVYTSSFKALDVWESALRQQQRIKEAQALAAATTTTTAPAVVVPGARRRV